MIKTQKIMEYSFEEFNDVISHTKLEKEKIMLLPLRDFMGNSLKISFKEDEYLSSNNGLLRFNNLGLRNLCNLLDIPEYFLQSLEKANLSTEVINDRLTEKMINRLKSMQAVYDTENSVVIGLVSESYVPYSNYSLIKDLKVEALLDKDFSLQEAVISNTRMFLKLISNKMYIENKTFPDPNAKDTIYFGLILQNSMTGNSAIRFDLLSYRLLCSNGLIKQASNEKNSVYHAGNIDTLKKRINTRLGDRIKDLPQWKKDTEKLMKIKFNSLSFYKASGFEILVNLGLLPKPESRQKKSEEFYSTLLDDLIDKQVWSKKVFKSSYRESATMWDLVNVFTELANNQPSYGKKIEMQKNAGKAAQWILNNAKKFN